MVRRFYSDDVVQLFAEVPENDKELVAKCLLLDAAWSGRHNAFESYPGLGVVWVYDDVFDRGHKWDRFYVFGEAAKTYHHNNEWV